MVVAAAQLAQPGGWCFTGNRAPLMDPGSPGVLCLLKPMRRAVPTWRVAALQVYNLTIRQFGALQSIAPNMHQMGYRLGWRSVC